MAPRNDEHQKKSTPAETQTSVGRGRVRGLIKSRFKGFDDDSDEDQVRPTPLQNGEYNAQTRSTSSLGKSQHAPVSHSLSIEVRVS